jgi:3',5'-cyclic AMP phosphodiesterase CpdA
MLNTVYYGLTTNCEKNVSEKNPSENSFHTVELTNLEKSMKYYYKVVSDGIESNIFSFYTSFDNNDSIRFIAYGDNRGEWDNWQNARIVAKAIEKEQPHFVLNTGDLVHNGTIEEEWLHFFEASSFIHNSTLYPVLGNHEEYGSYYFKYFKLTNNKLWYSFDSGPVHFIGLDSNYPNRIRPSQLFWLIKELRTTDKSFTIVFFHNPLYSSGNHGSNIPLRFYWGIFFQLNNVDIVINGHDHCYERGKVLNVNYIVTGGGGGPLYDVGSSWWTIYSEKTYHYCLFEANQSKLTFQAIKPDGTVFDSFQIMN